MFVKSCFVFETSRNHSIMQPSNTKARILFSAFRLPAPSSPKSITTPSSTPFLPPLLIPLHIPKRPPTNSLIRARPLTNPPLLSPEHQTPPSHCRQRTIPRDTEREAGLSGCGILGVAVEGAEGVESGCYKEGGESVGSFEVWFVWCG